MSLLATGMLVTGCAASQRPARTAPEAAPSGAVGAPAVAPANAPAPRAAAPDLHFMTGMIPHHAQAVIMAGWAPTRASSPSVRVLAERIVVAQRDEIALVRNWLREVGAPIPPANATHMRMNMGGMQHDMLMPGMLTEAEMAQLEKARGVAFDRLFLTFMIKHHEGAVTMVDQLFASYGAAQDETVFRFASDVYADQTTEINRMQKMLDALPPA